MHICELAPWLVHVLACSDLSLAGLAPALELPGHALRKTCAGAIAVWRRWAPGFRNIEYRPCFFFGIQLLLLQDPTMTFIDWGFP